MLSSQGIYGGIGIQKIPSFSVGRSAFVDHVVSQEVDSESSFLENKFLDSRKQISRDGNPPID